MAKKRSRSTIKKKIKNVLYRDKNIFKVFSKTHYLTREQILDLGMSKASLKRFIDAGVLEKKYEIINTQPYTLYRITPEGREWLQKDVFKEKIHFYSSSGVRHDMKIAQVVVDLLKSGIVNSVDDIKNEFEIQKEYKDLIEITRSQGDEARARELERLRDQGEISTPDFVYKNTRGQRIAVEAVTNSGSYTQAHLDSKSLYVETIGYDTIEFVK